jgi:hypothetical protein
MADQSAATPNPTPQNARKALIANERAKLFANALDRSSTACVTVGVLAPAAASLYGVGQQAPNSANLIVAGTFLWLGAAIVLHIFARVILGSLK